MMSKAVKNLFHFRKVRYHGPARHTTLINLRIASGACWRSAVTFALVNNESPQEREEKCRSVWNGPPAVLGRQAS